MGNVEIHPLTADRWADFERLFGPRGAYAGCWCMWPRLRSRDFAKRKGPENKEAMREVVESDEPPGLLAYVDGEPVGSFASFAETVRASKGRPLRVAYARDGQTRTLEIAAELQTVETGGLEEEAWLIGIVAEDVTLMGATLLDRTLNPFVAFPRAVAMTAETTTRFLRGFGKLVTGEISRRQIGGPIEIGRQAHLALQAGWDRYLELLIIISINLGILNLLPIPILDGGQALLFLVEGVRRGPLSLRTREIVQQFGFFLLVAIMGFAFWNDVTRNWSRLVEWVRESAGL